MKAVLICRELLLDVIRQEKKQDVDFFTSDELNTGQLKSLIQSRFEVRVTAYNKVQGLPFKTSEIKAKLLEILKSQTVTA
jgi:hypothetical protein